MPETNFNPAVSRYSPLVGQFLRYVVVGVINTLINFAVLNILSYFTGIKSGSQVVYLAAVAFFVATINSYILNKYWAFHDMSHFHEGRKMTLFLLVSLVGLSINSSIVYVVSTFVDPMFGASPTMWLNVAAIVATSVSLVWNFIGYKWIVFRS